MDTLTIIWYFSTFIALIAFFAVMVCSDNICNRDTEKPDETPLPAPPSPAPSYREFAPPGYDTVMKKHKQRIFLISTGAQETFTPMEPPPPPTPTATTPPETISSIRPATSDSSSLQEEEVIELTVLNTPATRRRSSNSSLSNQSSSGEGVDSTRVVYAQIEVSVISEDVESPPAAVIVSKEVVPSVILVVNERNKSDDSRFVSG